MAKVLVIGAGVCGLVTSMLLAEDGHDVTVLERDPTPPPEGADEAWQQWERRSVGQFRMVHMFLPRFTSLLHSELPHAVTEFEKAGAIRYNPLAVIPPEMIGGFREDDKQFESLTARRPVGEAALTRAANATPRVEVRRGVVVKEFVTGTASADGVPHITGVRTDDGTAITADVVIDASGRRSALPALLTAAGAHPPEEQIEDCGFMYYGRHFRSPNGEIPPLMCGILSPWGTISTLTLPCDNGTYGLALITSAKDAPMRALKDTDTWMRVWRSIPLVAHWADGEPIDNDSVAIMAKIEDRERKFVLDGTPVATGVLPVADSWACTNPSLGRGMSIGFVHAVALRDHLRNGALDDPLECARTWHDVTDATAGPWYRSTLSYDRHRLAEIEAEIEGRPYEPEGPEWEITRSWQHAATQDPELFRAFLRNAGVVSLPEEILAEPGVMDKIIELGSGWRDAEVPAPNRDELVSIVNG